jgi:hypothetical protein
MTSPTRAGAHGAKPPLKPPVQPSSTEHAADWVEHEHVAPPLEAQAGQLLKNAGSPGLAHQALDAAERHQPALGSPQDEFARQWGFTSYLELFEASTLVRSAVGKNWLVAVVPHGGWIVWNETDLHASRAFPTRDEAIAEIPAQAEA